MTNAAWTSYTTKTHSSMGKFQSHNLHRYTIYFLGVSATQELLKTRLKFIEVFKGATKKFSMKILSNFQLSGRFAHRKTVLYNDNQDIGIAAIVWANRDRLYVISTAS